MNITQQFHYFLLDKNQTVSSMYTGTRGYMILKQRGERKRLLMLGLLEKRTPKTFVADGWPRDGTRLRNSPPPQKKLKDGQKQRRRTQAYYNLVHVSDVYHKKVLIELDTVDITQPLRAPISQTIRPTPFTDG